MMRKLFLLFLLAVLHCSMGMAANEYDELDHLIGQRKAITDKKLLQIGNIRQRLSTPYLTDKQRYKICMQLYDEYEAFRFDSALVYANRTIMYAKRVGDPKWIVEAQLKKVHVYTLAALFLESRELLDTLSTMVLDDRLRQDYYKEWFLLMMFMSEFTAGTQMHKYYDKQADYYSGLILKSPYKDTRAYIMVKANDLSERGNTEEAIAMLKEYLQKWQRHEHEYAMITSELARLYGKLGNTDKQYFYLIESAMSDIRSSVKENNSLRLLATLLFEKGDVERAYKYLNVSIEDANFYGTHLRNSQNSHILPRILSVYLVQKRAQSRRITILLAVVSLVAIALVVAILFILKLLKRYRKMNKRVVVMNHQLNEAVENLSKVNAQISETNSIKEEYIARFLELVSKFIDRVDERRKLYNRLAREKRMEELYTELKNSDFIQTATRHYYINFDTAFLNIYPNFVTEVNQLLRPDGQIEPKGDERLTTELRILALIRLGITDNARISSILRASLTTVYTYRSKLKARAIDHDGFENAVKKIG